MDGIKKIIPPEQVAFTTHITVESGKYIYIFNFTQQCFISQCNLVTLLTYCSFS